jgi:hypothetical protein
MKKALCLFTLAFLIGLAATTSSYAQTERKNLIKVNFLSPIVSTGSFFYERVISEISSVQLGLFYTGASIGSGDAETKVRGFGITPEYRFYLSEKGAPQGFFIAPYVRYQNFALTSTFDGTEDKATFSGFGGGAVLGGQWLFKDRVSLEVFGGPGYSGGAFKYEGDATEDDFTTTGFDGFTFRFGATVGIAF